MQIQPGSFAFTLLLGFLAAVPHSGIDINLPALAATGGAGSSLRRSAQTVEYHPCQAKLSARAR
jgi:hypothetical protein